MLGCINRFYSIQNQFAVPLVVIAGSFASAVVVFILMFIVRKFLGYVFFTPDAIDLTIEEKAQVQNENNFVEEWPSLDQTSSVEFQDENSEEVAKVVRTMMHTDEENLQLNN